MNPEARLAAMQNAAAVVVAAELHRHRRSRRYSGWRARLASWLRSLADLVNPLEG